jgi:hypothetical protein
MREAGFCTRTYEILDGRDQNILTCRGYVRAVNDVLSLKPGGLCLLAVVCSSWVFMNRFTSGRSLLRPLGNSRKYVKRANIMMARCCLLVELLAARGCVWVIENPVSSLLFSHPRFQRMLAEGLQCWRVVLSLGAFGAGSRKPIQLVSNAPWLAELASCHPALGPPPDIGVVTLTGVSRSGRVQVQGGPGLRATQAYPPAFGREFARLYRQHRRTP